MPHPRGDDWLADDMRSLRAGNIDVLVSLLTRDEIWDLGLADEPQQCMSAGMSFLSFPIPDRGVPPTDTSTLGFISQLADLVAQGKHVAIHCWGGIGRSTTLAACVLILHGYTAAEALAQLRKARGREVPDTASQIAWIVAFAQWHNG
jgi:protein-tyrosine phosphatase